MLKNVASICAALIIAVAAFSTSAQAKHGGGHFGSVRAGGAYFHGARITGGRYHVRYYGGGYHRYGHYYGGGYHRYGYWPYWAAGVAAGALISAEPYYYGDGYGYYGDGYYEEPSYYQTDEYYYSPQCPYYGHNNLWWCH